jgi:hypothetical protein
MNNAMEIERLHDRLKAEGKLSLQVRIVPRSPKTEWAGFLESRNSYCGPCRPSLTGVGSFKWEK